MSDRRVIDCELLWAQTRRTPGLLPIVQRWCRLNGINPSQVPVDSKMIIEDSAYGLVIRYDAYLTTEDGYRYVDPNNPDQAAVEPRTAVLAVAPPDAWLNLPDGAQ